MLLAIDIGNTNIVFALFDADVLHKTARLPTYHSNYHDADIDFSVVSDVVIGSVVPAVEANISAFCKSVTGKAPLFVNAENVGIDIAFARPKEVGADRLINVKALKTRYQSPAIIIDFGTATTFDVIDTDMRYHGGVIAPGINLSLAALEQAAAKLPKIEIKKPPHIIGQTTTEAMQSGIFYGYVSMIEGIVDRLAQDMLRINRNNANPFVIATGGLAPLFAGETDVIADVDPELTLRGLVEVYKENA